MKSTVVTIYRGAVDPMSMITIVFLESTGSLLEATHIMPPGFDPNYGQLLPYIMEDLNAFCDEIGVAPIGNFLCATAYTSPKWYDAAVGLQSFEPLLSELIYRYDSDLPNELNNPGVLWEVRAFEQALRVAERRNERFHIYLSV